MSTDTATLLGEHADCITNCDIKTDGVRDGQMWYVIHWTCGMTSGPLTLGSVPIRNDHRAHLAAVIDAHTAQVVREVAEKAWDEGYRRSTDDWETDRHTPSPNSYRSADL